MKTRKLLLELEIAVKDTEHESYLFADVADGTESTSPQLGFVADLFDLFNFEAALGVEKINGFTHNQIKKTLGLS